MARKKITPAERRKLLAKPASKLSASQLDTRRELISEGRLKTTPAAKRKKKAAGKKVRTVGGVARTLRGRGKL
jgi:hypothetical protein